MDMAGVIIDTAMTGTISTKCHAVCHLHFMAKLDLCCNKSFTDNTRDCCTANSANSFDSCSLENGLDNLIDVFGRTASLYQKTDNIASLFCKDTFLLKMILCPCHGYFSSCRKDSIFLDLYSTSAGFLKLDDFLL